MGLTNLYLAKNIAPKEDTDLMGRSMSSDLEAKQMNPRRCQRPKDLTVIHIG